MYVKVPQYDNYPATDAPAREWLLTPKFLSPGELGWSQLVDGSWGYLVEPGWSQLVDGRWVYSGKLYVVLNDQCEDTSGVPHALLPKTGRNLTANEKKKFVKFESSVVPRA